MVALRDGKYEAMAAGEDGILRSGMFAGLWLDAAALMKGDLGRVLAVVEAGVSTVDHAGFVGKLK